MWNVTPTIMCRNHLLGEHVELHMIVECIIRNKSIQGFINHNLIEPSHIKERHNQLVFEMEKRGYHHKSPLPDFKVPNDKSKINSKKSQKELFARCKKCKKNYLKEKNK